MPKLILDPAVARSNILATWARVDALDRREGLVAYDRLHEVMKTLGRHYNVPLANVVGAFAALSPNNDYMGNLRSLVTLMNGQREGRAVTDCTISTYHACRTRAWACLSGEDFLSFTKGPKTRNFYVNILQPSDPVAVTIDGHMVCVAKGQRMNMKDVVRSGFVYEDIAAHFRTIAGELNLLPQQLQATLWFTWKRIHRVLAPSQLDLFRGDDQWAFGIDPLTVRPFPSKAVDRARTRLLGSGGRSGAEKIFP